MLTQHEKIQPALVKCHSEGLTRTAPGGNAIPSRFVAVVDDRGAELGHVTSRFKLIQTADVVAAFDLAAERVGYEFEPRAAWYHNGLAKIELDIPSRRVDLSGRDGGVTPRVIMIHGLGGRGGLRIFTGGEIGVCTNGMVFGKLIDVQYARHTTGLNIGRAVQRSVDKLDTAIRQNEMLIEAARATRARTITADTLIEATPERFARTFREILDRNSRTYEGSVWGAIQAVTELATHHMRERRDGSHVWSADTWSQARVRDLAISHGLVPATR